MPGKEEKKKVKYKEIREQKRNNKAIAKALVEVTTSKSDSAQALEAKKGNRKKIKDRIISRFPIAQQYNFNVYPDKNVSKSDIANIETFVGND